MTTDGVLHLPQSRFWARGRQRLSVCHVRAIFDLVTPLFSAGAFRTGLRLGGENSLSQFDYECKLAPKHSLAFSEKKT